LVQALPKFTNYKFALFTVPTTRNHEARQYSSNYVYDRKGYGQMYYYILGLSTYFTYLASDRNWDPVSTK